jgi:dUTP pyrophosphatase
MYTDWETFEKEQDPIWEQLHVDTGQLPLIHLRGACRRKQIALVPRASTLQDDAISDLGWEMVKKEHAAASPEGYAIAGARFELLRAVANDKSLVPVKCNLPMVTKPQYQPKVEYDAGPVVVENPSMHVEPVMEWTPLKNWAGHIPEFHYPGDVGFDLTIVEDAWIEPDEITDVPVGIAVHMPPGYWGLIIGRSSTERKLGVRCVTGVIDNGYTGPLYAAFQSITGKSILLHAGMKPAQMLLLPIPPRPVFEEVDHLRETDRGSNGFGSTGGFE